MHTFTRRLHLPTRMPWLMSSLAPLAAAALAACSSLPADNTALQQARSHYSAAQGNPQSATMAPAEMRQAGDALAQADAAWKRGDSTAEVDHLAYVADQRISIAQETVRQKSAEGAMAGASAERDRMRLAARTNEADDARRQATAAQRGESQAQQQAAASARQADASQRQTDLARQQAAASQQQAGAADLRNSELQAQIRDLNARQTPRGLVITIGDVLFDTARAELKPGAERNMDKLVSFMQQYPKRKALVEGFTDSVGSEASNQVLSGQRADAVRMALLGRGVQADRVSTQGYGEAFPVAGNDTSGGRQSNRRVEIILSDETGQISAR